MIQRSFINRLRLSGNPAKLSKMQKQIQHIDLLSVFAPSPDRKGDRYYFHYGHYQGEWGVSCRTKFKDDTLSVSFTSHSVPPITVLKMFGYNEPSISIYLNYISLQEKIYGEFEYNHPLCKDHMFDLMTHERIPGHVRHVILGMF